MTGKLLKTTGMAALAAATLTAAMTSGARAQAFEDIGDLGGGRARVEGINASGQVVGSAFTAGGAEHAIIWRNGAMTDLGVLGGGAPEVAVSSVVSLIGLVGALSTFLLDRFVVASIGLVSPPPDAVNFKLSPVVEVFGRPKPLVLSYLEAT
jgi:probable HAF family extracellular repeat protein